MRVGSWIVLAAGLMVSTVVSSFDIGLVPLHEFSEQEENVFRRQLAEIEQQPYLERVYVSGAPICPETPDLIDVSWQQDIICF